MTHSEGARLRVPQCVGVIPPALQCSDTLYQQFDPHSVGAGSEIGKGGPGHGSPGPLLISSPGMGEHRPLEQDGNHRDGKKKLKEADHPTISRITLGLIGRPDADRKPSAASSAAIMRRERVLPVLGLRRARRRASR